MNKPGFACNILFAVIVLTFCAGTVDAQKKVANFSYGSAGTAQYEHFSFWADEKKPAGIHYQYGTERKEVKLQFAGKAVLAGRKGFKVLFPNKLLLYIIPGLKNIQVKAVNGTYNKTFIWEYEGPVNGIGTYCDACTRDEAEAVSLLKDTYLR